jgi:hypothetical protein
MNHGVIYLLTGPAHAARLVVSLRSLRDHYRGPVTVYTTQPESHEIGRRCAADARLDVEHRMASKVAVRRNGSFLTKLELLPQAPYEITAYLDADTMVVGDIADLFDIRPADQFCATQFSDWRSGDRVLRRRIERWRTIEQDRFDPQWFQRLIDDALQNHPAINTGVFAFRRGADVVEPWRELAMVGRRTFICDEIALQLLLHRHPHKLLDSRYNCSPIHVARRRDTRVWHFHGEKHFRRECRPIWWPAYQRCIEENVAGLAEWTPAGDPHLKEHLEQGQVKP